MPLVPPTVVFVRPQAAGNIGALARVMSNFGCTDLRLVGTSPVYGLNPGDPFSRMDWAMAKRGEPVLKNSQWFASLTEALSGCHLAIGSSGRSVEFERGYARPLVGPEEAFAGVAEWQAKAKSDGENFRWALVLGSEDDGLWDDEAALCQKLIRLSTVDESPSINLAMAAGLMLYHWHLVNAGLAKISATPDAGPFLKTERQRPFSEAGRGQWASIDQLETFLSYLMDTVAMTQFLKYPDQEAVRARLRRWVQMAPVPLGELLFAFEIIYHLRAWGSGHFEARDFLRGGVKGEEWPAHPLKIPVEIKS